MKRIILSLLFIILLAPSCKTTKDIITPIEQKIKSVELGMSKNSVITIMGTSYQIVGKELTPEGAVETLGYYDYTNGMYKFHIQDGKLTKWEYSPGIKYNYSRHPE